jgi:hypothetical protein
MDFVSSLLTIFLLVLVVVLVIAPFESLKWWAGWVTEDAETSRDSTAAMAVGPTSAAHGVQPDQYVIFLPGVGTMGTEVDSWEQSLVDLLQQGLDSGVVLAGLFPFTVREDTLTEHRGTAGFWRWLAHIRDTRPSLIARLIDWRNLTQVFVSMDPRYGPIYNKGVDEKLARVLDDQGYLAGNARPITLIGYSGGAQIAVGASLYLAHDMRASVRVISLGGVLGDDPALASVEHLYHLWGAKDLESRMATAVVPARWPIAKRSFWNRAIAERRLTQECLGAMGHTGPKGYLDANTLAPDGRSYLEVTASAMLRIIAAHAG